MNLRLSLRPFSLALLLATACGGSSQATEPRAAQPAPATAAAAEDPSCPVAVPGTSVTVEDTDTGAALVFVTTSDVTGVRTRVAAMAAMHNEHHGAMGPLPDGSEHAGHDMGAHAGHDMGNHAGHDMGNHAGHDMGNHAGHDMGSHAGHAGGMIGVHSKATASEVEGGAKLAFTSGAADVAKLQSELRMHAQHMAAGTCAMGSR